LARAKNTSRAEARRRTRETIRAEAAEPENGEELEESAEQTAQPERRPLFRMPNLREDIRALPTMFRTRRLLWAPLLLLIGGLVGVLLYPGLSPEIGSIVGFYIQFFFLPPALFTFFIAGFVAPRASYLVGFIYGVIWAILFGAGYLAVGNTVQSTDAPINTSPADPVAVFGQLLPLGILYGTLAAAFAAWYRDFLRQMQARGRDRRAEQEAKERAKRREERQEARRTAKGRSSS
jgi:hypothetical protein